MNRAQRCFHLALEAADKADDVDQLLIAANNARSLLLSSGLCTLAAFLAARNDVKGSRQDKAYQQVLQAMAKFAGIEPGNFVREVASAQTARYLHLSELARETLIFLARAAEMRKHAQASHGG
ncbi:MAG: type III-B CRISPR module-associated protein Cmr5 [Fimbriimonadaceae bacterium]